MFSPSTEDTLIYSPDFERENRLLSLYNAIEKKITFFDLPAGEVKKLINACGDIETSCIIGFDTETLNGRQPEDIYNFCLAIEEKYSPALTNFESWLSKNRKELKPDKAESLISLISLLGSAGELSVSMDFIGLKSTLGQVLQNSSDAVFSQSWMLRMVLEILQPFKKYRHAYPAAVQSVFLDLKGKNLKGLLHINFEALERKAELENRLAPFEGLTASELRSTDLTPLLAFGYDIIEANLVRIDELVKQIFRNQVKYHKKEPRIRNLLNYLYTEGLEPLSAHMPYYNERQQQIIKYLFTKRYLGTKELTLDFKCDRKTIQRDFTKLLSTEVVKSTGNGSALKYCINLKNNGYDMLEIYSTATRRREDYQESLFGEEIWEAKEV